MSGAVDLVHVSGEFLLESGARLPELRQAYRLEGPLNRERSNVVVVLHALTGSSVASCPERGWWRGVIGPGLAVDTTQWAVLSPNLLGSCYGTTGPASWGGAPRDFPPVTTRDMARAVGLLLAGLGIEHPRMVVGGSLGGMVTMEWVLEHPHATDAAVVFAAPDAHPALAIGWNQAQLTALRLGELLGDAAVGIALARQIAMLSFRSGEGLGARFGRQLGDPAGTGRFQVQEWMEHHGRALAARFDAETYRVLLQAMDGHDISRNRGDLATARRQLRARVPQLIGVGIPGDMLYPAPEIRRWTEASAGRYQEIDSLHGHDAFLLEVAQVSAILSGVLEPRT